MAKNVVRYLAGNQKCCMYHADLIDTYVYRLSFMTGSNFGYTTAVGLFKSVIGVILITAANKIVVKSGEEGLF